MEQYLPFVFAAYTLVWIGMFLYILSIGRRNRGLETELRELRELLTRNEGR
jgi:CcmD family protein